MRKFFYTRLAFTNLKNNSQTYGPFLLTSIGTVVMFYNIVALTKNESVMQTSGSLLVLLMLGVVLTAIFSVILLLYTSSFLVKRRLKEFGLFNILGMDKPNISRMLLCENALVAAVSIGAGLFFGILFNGVFALLLQRILRFDPNYTFDVNVTALLITALLFVGVFVLILCSNLWRVWRFQPAELLRDASAGEREPKTKWLLTALGVITLGTGYYIAVTLQSPMKSIGAFLIAVVLVIFGTYFLFTAGSIAVLKALRKNKAYYYQTSHFTAVSGMMYRMKKNAAGLASICVLLTAIIVMVSTTGSMYVGMEDILRTRFPSDIEFAVSFDDEEQFTMAAYDDSVQATAQTIGCTVQSYTSARYFSLIAERDGASFAYGASNYATTENATVLYVLSPQEYTRLTGEPVQLAPTQLLINDNHGQIGQSITLFGKTYDVLPLDETRALVGGVYTSAISHVLTIVMPTQEAYRALYQEQKQIAVNSINQMRYNVMFDVDGTPEQEIEFAKTLRETMGENAPAIFSREAKRAEFYELYGLILFLGIFLGTLALMAMVLIIYYKQVAEGVEDRRRFAIMQQVGMSPQEVKRAIHSQILTVFLLPLAMTAIHMVAAFPLLVKLLAILNLTNSALFAVCAVITLAVFALVYMAVYFVTARVYYRIVHG